MKFRFVLIVVSLIFFFVGCEKDDDDRNEIAICGTTVSFEGVFDGSWYMVKSSGGITGAEGNIPEGKVVWNFNNQDSTVVVTNNYVEPEMIIYAGPQSGTYDFSTQLVNDNSLLFFDNERIGGYSMVNDTLIVDQIYTGDGFTFEFVR